MSSDEKPAEDIKEARVITGEVAYGKFHKKVLAAVLYGAERLCYVSLAFFIVLHERGLWKTQKGGWE